MLRSFNLFQLSVVLAVILGSVLSVCSQSKKPTSDDIIRELSSRFKRYKTYQVKGTYALIKNINLFKGKSWEQALTADRLETVDKLAFTLYFERPNRLRFDWLPLDSQARRPLSVWSNGKRNFEWRSSLDEPSGYILNDLSTLEYAIDENGSSGMGSLLLDQLKPGKLSVLFSEITDPKIVRKETVDGHVCYLIFGSLRRDPWALWIDASSFILRRLRMQIAIGSFDKAVETGVRHLTLAEVGFKDVQVNDHIPTQICNYRPKLLPGDIDLTKMRTKERLVLPPVPR